VVHSVLGGVLDLDPDERSLLLETVEVWVEAGGSATEAGKRLYCHRNTVRNRLARLEELTGRSLSDPRSLAEVCTAVEAVRLLPADVLFP
jgi:DNA-binding PucR family transcriptional regulator